MDMGDGLEGGLSKSNIQKYYQEGELKIRLLTYQEE